MPHRSTTGLTATQIATLITALANHLSWVKPAEKSRRLALAHLFEGSQPTILADHQNYRESPRNNPHSIHSHLGREPDSTWLSRD